MRRFPGFAIRLTALHIVTYFVFGAVSYQLIAHRYYSGPEALPWLRNPETDPYVMGWFLPAQVLRGVLYAAVLFPLRRHLLDMRWRGVLQLAALMLILGSFAGINGVIESVVYTTAFSWGQYGAHFPEIFLQSIAFAFLVVWWESRIEQRAAVAKAAAV